MLITILLWGILFAIGNIISQYWITTAAGGLFISGMGQQYIVLGGILFLILSLASILLSNYMYSPTKQLS
jgi:MFS transporter, DHA1 family, inner membrane transport protein